MLAGEVRKKGCRQRPGRAGQGRTGPGMQGSRDAAEQRRVAGSRAAPGVCSEETRHALKIQEDAGPGGKMMGEQQGQVQGISNGDEPWRKQACLDSGSLAQIKDRGTRKPLSSPGEGIFFFSCNC